MRYRIETHPNCDRRTIHVEQPLFSASVEKFGDVETYGRGVAEDDRAMIVELVAIVGVTDVLTRAYYLSVGKASVFSWDEVMPPALAILERRYGELIEAPAGACRTDDLELIRDLDGRDWSC